MNIVHITEENFKDIDPKLLLDPQWYNDVEDMVVSIDAAYTPDYAKEFVLPMRDKLLQVGEQMQPELLAAYMALLKALLLYSVATMKDGEKERYFKENILDVFYLDFVDVKNWIDINFRSYHRSPDIIEQHRQIFLRGLENNSQVLGVEPIVSSENRNSLAPTIHNWLLDYNATVHINPREKRRGRFEEINYVNKSPNTQSLGKDEQGILLKVLEIYDWLRFDPLRYDFSLPGQAPLLEDERLPVNNVNYEIIPQDLAEAVNKVRDERQKLMQAGSSRVVAEDLEVGKKVKLAPSVPKGKGQKGKAASNGREQAKIDQKLEELKRKIKQ